MGKEIDLIKADDDDDELIVPKKKKRKQLIDSDEENEPTAAEIIISSDSESSASSGDEAEDAEDESEGSGESESEYDSESDEADSEISEDTPLTWEAVFTDGDLGTTSEAEEGRLQERFDSAMKLIGNSRVQEGFELLCSILKEPLIQKQKAADIDAVDWTALKATYNPHLESKMRTLAFSIHREIARITTKPIGFYIQALIIRPTDRKLWYEFGCAAAKQRNWKWAEIAFRECQQDPNAVLKLALVYFYSEQYHKCLPLLHSLLSKGPAQHACLVLKSEIKRKSPFWSTMVDLYFPQNPLLPEIQVPAHIHEALLARMDKFIAQTSGSEESEPNVSVVSLEIEPVKINLEKCTMEDFGRLLCNYHDQSNAVQLPTLSKIHFVKDRRHASHRNLASERTESVMECVVDEVIVPPEDPDNLICQSVVNDMLDIIDVVGSMVETVASGKVPKLKIPKKKSPKKVIRRSTRKVEDIIPDFINSPSYLPTSGANIEPLTIRSLLGISEGDTGFEPLSFPGTSTTYVEHIVVDVISPYELESFGAFLNCLINDGEMTMEKAVVSYLSYIASALPEGCRLSKKQRFRFLELYTRWVNTFLEPFPDTCVFSSVKEIAIHVLALELDDKRVTRAAEACRAMFENPFGFGRFVRGREREIVDEKEKEDPSDIGIRKKALKLLEEADAAMAQQVKDRLTGLKIASKRMNKAANVIDAARNLVFVRDVYRPRILLSTQEKNQGKDSGASASVTSVSEGIDGDAPSWIKFKFSVHWMEQLLCSESGNDIIDNGVDLSLLMDICANLLKVAQERGFEIRWSDELVSKVIGMSNGKSSKQFIQEFLDHVKAIITSSPDEAKLPRDSVISILTKADETVTNIMNADDNQMEIDYSFETRELEELRKLVIRYFWANYIREETEEEKNAFLYLLVQTVKTDRVIYSQLVDENYKHSTIALKFIVERFVGLYRWKKLEQIQELYRKEKYREVVDHFTTKFNWKGVADSVLVDNLRMLLHCFVALGDRKAAVQWICRMLDKVIEGKFEDQRDATYIGCLQQLNQLDLESVDHESLRLISKRLVVCTEYKRFRSNATLWKILYRVVSILEGEYTCDEDRLALYEEIEGYLLIMPTKALCILAEGHRILAEEKCCKKHKGEFLYFVIEEIYKGCMKNKFSQKMMEYGIVKTIQRNIELQLMQCLRCLFDSSVAKAVLDDHGDSLNHKPTVKIAAKVIPFLVPRLPMFDDDKFATNDVIDTITKIFGFIDEMTLDGIEEATKKLEEVVDDPPLFHFTEVDHELSLVGDYEKVSKWPALDITEKNREDLEFFAYMKYIFIVLKYRKASKESNWKNRIKECLVISGPSERGLLPPQMLHSLWAMYGYAYLDYFCEKTDEELLDCLSSCLYLFKMAFLLYPKAFALHIDTVNVYYQLNSRMRRLKHHMKVEKTFTPEIETKMEREKMESQCQLHLSVFKHRISLTNEYPKDISWMEPYFSGKLAEHQRRPLGEVFGHYYRCAMLMREEEYTYPLRVQRIKQENFEPLEIHYRVHVYALKQIYIIDRLKKITMNSLRKLHLIRNYLRLFLGHFIFVKKPVPIPPVETTLPFISSVPDGDFEHPDWSLLREEKDDDDHQIRNAEDSTDVQWSVNGLVEFTDLRIECIELCRRAFETIVKRFPHYKSYYRLAVLHLTEGNSPQKSLDVIINRLYKGKFQSFEEVQEITRTDFERSGTLTYHLNKIIVLTIPLLCRCKDLARLTAVLENLLKAQNFEKIHLSPKAQQRYISLCVEGYKTTVESLSKETDQEKIDRTVKFVEKAVSILKLKNRPEASTMAKTLEVAKGIARILMMKMYLRNEMERKKREEETRKKAEELRKKEEEKKREEEQRKREEQKKREEEFRKRLEEMKKAEEQKKKEENEKKMEIERTKKEEERKKALEQEKEKKEILEQMVTLLRSFQPDAVDEFVKNKARYVAFDIKALRDSYSKLYTAFMVSGIKQAQKRPAQSEGSDPKQKMRKPNEKTANPVISQSPQQQNQKQANLFTQMANELRKNIEKSHDAVSGAGSQQQTMETKIVNELVQRIKHATSQQQKSQGTSEATKSSVQQAQKSPRVQPSQKLPLGTAMPSTGSSQRSPMRQVIPPVQPSPKQGTSKSLPTLQRTGEQGGQKEIVNSQTTQSQKNGNTKTPERSQMNHQQRSQGTASTSLQGNLGARQSLQQSPVRPAAVQANPQTPTLPRASQQQVGGQGGLMNAPNSQQRTNQNEASRKSGVQLMRQNVETVGSSPQHPQLSQSSQRALETSNLQQTSTPAVPRTPQQNSKVSASSTIQSNQQSQISRSNFSAQSIQQHQRSQGISNAGSHQGIAHVQQSPQYFSRTQTTPVLSSQQPHQFPANRGLATPQSSHYQQRSQEVLNAHQIAHHGNVNIQQFMQQSSSPQAVRTVQQSQQMGGSNTQAMHHSMQSQMTTNTGSQQQFRGHGIPVVQQTPPQHSRIQTTPVKSNQQLGNPEYYQTALLSQATVYSTQSNQVPVQYIQQQGVQSSHPQSLRNVSSVGIQQTVPQSPRNQTMFPVQSSPQYWNTGLQQSTQQSQRSQATTSMQFSQQNHTSAGVQLFQGNQSFTQQQFPGGGESGTNIQTTQRVQGNAFSQPNPSTSMGADDVQVISIHSSPVTRNPQLQGTAEPPKTPQNPPQPIQSPYSTSNIHTRFSQLNPLQRETFNTIMTYMPAQYNNSAMVDQIFSMVSNVYSLDSQKNLLDKFAFIPKNQT